MIQEAIETLQYAIQAFKPAKRINQHGIALSEFQLGYLYVNYEQYLPLTSSERKLLPRPLTSSESKTSDNKEEAAGTEGTHIDLAYEHFNEAFIHFKAINHLKGMELTKRQIYDLIKESDINKNELSKIKADF